jgi:hypothetical protein
MLGLGGQGAFGKLIGYSVRGATGDGMTRSSRAVALISPIAAMAMAQILVSPVKVIAATDDTTNMETVMDSGC